MMSDPTLQWLLEGDPSIRWQVMRDLLDRPAKQWRAEQQRTLAQGWAAALLARREPDGRWGGGLYSPKWTSTTYTLLLLRDLGLPRDCAAAQRGARLVLDGMLGVARDAQFEARLARCDRCIVGMMLRLAVYFGVEDDRVSALVENLLAEQMPDGGWNCRRGRRPIPHHSSFHTTFNVLDGLREFVELRRSGLHQRVLRAEENALEFMLQHKLYRSDKTGAVINEKFTLLSFPPRWHYDVLRGLSHFARAGAPRDRRLRDPIELLRRRQRSDGLWPVQHKYAGRVFFEMERTGGPSRWNTLRALRVLRWWEGA